MRGIAWRLDRDAGRIEPGRQLPFVRQSLKYVANDDSEIFVNVH